jgi:hypothetical protein
MLTREQVEAFWKDRASRAGMVADPCHYMNYWMDLYTWETRTGALDKLSCIKNAETLVDIGCGVGMHTKNMFFNMRSSTARAIGYDRRPFIMNTSVVPEGVTFKEGLVPDPEIQKDIKGADVVTLITVYDFMSTEDRATLRSYLADMRQDSYVVMIDLFMDTVPWHQNELSYKEVRTWNEKVSEMMEIGFVEDEQLVVSKANMRVFHKLGKNAFSYALSKIIDTLPLVTPQVMAVAFRKV